ncbi:MAG: hypothetical protein GWP14_11070 [Actinobacteria bacterium]|nr:hypothetical protein [Actinomycetota bacterium]
MNSRQIIERTLDFNHPERVGRSFACGPDDFVWVSHTAKTHATDWQQTGQGLWRRQDEWGNTWSRLDPSSKGEVTEGVLKSLAGADSYELPDFSNPQDYQRAQKIRQENEYKYVLARVPGFAFNIARKLLKLDTYLMALMLDTERVRKLHDRIDELVADMIGNYAAVGVDGIFFPEDWGTQKQTLISPQMWREEFFPRFGKLCGLCHQCGITVFMHSCGKITAIIPGLIEAGVDVLQFDQPTLHGLDTLADFQSAAKISFWCPVDIQKTLQTRDEQIIRAEARRMLDKLWKGRGGFIAGYYNDNASIGLSPEVQGWACDEFIKQGLAEHYK